MFWTIWFLRIIMCHGRGTWIKCVCVVCLCACLLLLIHLRACVVMCAWVCMYGTVCVQMSVWEAWCVCIHVVAVVCFWMCVFICSSSADSPPAYKITGQNHFFTAPYQEIWKKGWLDGANPMPNGPVQAPMGHPLSTHSTHPFCPPLPLHSVSGNEL